MNTKDIGEFSESVILSRLLSLGYAVLLPFGNNKRYDIVCEKNGKFIRGQCKTGKIKNGCVNFWACSTNGFTGEKRDYHGQIDVFWVYCPENRKVYEIPIGLVGKTSVSLRITKPKNKQIKNIRIAKDFEL